MATKKRTTSVKKAKARKPTTSQPVPSVSVGKVALWTAITVFSVVGILVLSMWSWCSGGHSGQPWLNAFTNPLCPTRTANDLAWDEYNNQQTLQVIRQLSEESQQPTAVPTEKPHSSKGYWLSVPVPNEGHNGLGCFFVAGNDAYDVCNKTRTQRIWVSTP